MLHVTGLLKEAITAELPANALVGPDGVFWYSSNIRYELWQLRKCMDNEWACYCAITSCAFSLISWGDKRSFSCCCKWRWTEWVFSLQSKVSTESSRDIMNGHISDMKEKRNSFAGLLRTAPGFTRHPTAIWLHQMLWVTNMASQLRAAQRTLSCLLGPVTENTATWKTMWLLCRNVVYLTSRRCRARLWCDLMLWTYAGAAGRDACVAREYFCKEEMIRTSRDDVLPLPNMWWNATGMKRRSWGNAAGYIQTMVELWKL